MTDMKDLGIWEPFTVKTQTYKTAVEVMIQTTEIYRVYATTMNFQGSLFFGLSVSTEQKRGRGQAWPGL